MSSSFRDDANRRDLLTFGVGLALSAAIPKAALATQAYPYSAGSEPPRTPAVAGATDCHMHFFDKRVATVPGAPVLHRTRSPTTTGRSSAGWDFSGTSSSRPRLTVRTTRSRWPVWPRWAPMHVASLSSIPLSPMRSCSVCTVSGSEVSASISSRPVPHPWTWRSRSPHASSRLAGISSSICRPSDGGGRVSPCAASRTDRLRSHGPRCSTRRRRESKLRHAVPAPRPRQHMGQAVGPYLNTRQGGPEYPDASAVARELARIAPERMVWGSDWPHATETTKPDDAQLFDLFSAWAPDEGVRRRILVQNPAELYDFPVCRSCACRRCHAPPWINLSMARASSAHSRWTNAECWPSWMTNS